MRASRTLAWLLPLALLLAVGGWFAYDRLSDRKSGPEYRTVKVERGALTASVSATGTLNAVVQVQVGSQVSGQIKEVLVDYNSEVKKGQLIARIDPETFEYRVRQAMADLDAARAQVLTANANVAAARAAVTRAEVNGAEARRDLDRKQMLVEKAFIAVSELDKARAVHDAAAQDVRSQEAQVDVATAQAGSAQAAVKQREALLAQARIDLDRTGIRAPVDGIVIKRSIDAGQTVAASLQAPELFVIAKTLRDMQVDTSVDESEIGRVKVGQRATFTVDSFPGRSFSGEVLQVRKAALNVQNVITYIVVVSANNPELLLVPGMTANVRIVTEQRADVLKLPNAALRFKPAGFQESPTAGGGAATHAAPAAGMSGGATGAGGQSRQLRERLETELALTAEQKPKLEAAFAAMRDKFMAVRQAPEAERAKLSERNRAELRERINEFLTPEQRKRYAEMMAESAGRQPTRGRVFAPDDKRQPKPVNLRLGLSDGVSTEIIGVELKEGDEVIIGTQLAGQAGRPSSGPRLPF